MSDVRAKQQPNSARFGLDFQIHSSYYNDFFLLRIPITINGRPAVIKTVNGEPVLRYDGITVELSTVLQRAVVPVATKHGVNAVLNFYYEQVALFLINFQCKYFLKKFLTKKEAFQKEMSTAITNLFKEEAKSSKQPQSSQPPSMEQFQVAVDVKVYLVSPAVGRPPVVHEINLANHSFMFETWKRSKLFDFANAMFTHKPPTTNGDRTFNLVSGDMPNVAGTLSESGMHVTGLNKSRQSVVDSSARLAALQVELRGVIEWFSLGVQLKIPMDELMTIRKDHRYTYDCRLEMLIRWEQLEKPTWTKLVSALVNIGRRDIAKKIAKKHGVPLPATEEPRVQGPGIHIHKNVESSGCGNHPRTTDSVKSGECLSLLEEEVERATQTRDAVSKGLEMDIDTTLPELQMKVSSLNQDVRLLKTELRNREEENQMLKEAQQSLKKWNETIQRTRRENREAIKVLREEINKKEEELAQTKAQLADKEKELSEKMKELDVKSARVLELQNELENVRREFINQQEEMDQQLIESEAYAQSREKYLEEIEIQRDIAEKEANKKKDEIQSYTKELRNKEEEIGQLSEKIAEQEKEMAKLREELESRHHTSEQLSAEQMREDDEREQRLLTLMMSAMKLQLELRQTKDRTNQDKINLEGAKKTVEKYETMVAHELNNHMALVEDQRSRIEVVTLVESSPDVPAPVPLDRQPDTLTHPAKPNPQKDVCERVIDPPGPSISLSWSDAKSAPNRIVRWVDAAVDGDTVYFRPLSIQHVYAYYSARDEWRQLLDTPTWSSSITVINGALTTVGGERNGKGSNQIFSFVEESDGRRKWVETLPPMPKIDGHTRIVCCGTYVLVAGKFISTIELLDIVSQKWSRVSNQPCCNPKAHLHSLVMCGEYLYLVYSDNRVFKCSTSDLIQSTESNETGIWTELDHTGCLSKSTFVAIQCRLISVGGLDSQRNPSTAIKLYSPATESWDVIGHMKTPRWCCLAAVLPNNRLLVAGGRTGTKLNSTTNSVEIATIM